MKSAELAGKIWENLLAGKEQLRIELRLKRKWAVIHDIRSESSEDINHYIWMLLSASPSLQVDGSVEEITCVFTDISHQKWSERSQQLQADNALEARRQLEQLMVCQFMWTISYYLSSKTLGQDHAASNFYVNVITCGSIQI